MSCTPESLAESVACLAKEDQRTIFGALILAACQADGSESSLESLAEAASCFQNRDDKTLLACLVSAISQKNSSAPKVYRALLNQTGTNDPVPIVLENSIGPVTWQRNSQGIYVAFYNNGAWPSANIWLSVGGVPQAGDVWPFYVSGGFVVLNKFNMFINLGNLDYLLIDELSSVNVEIYLYP